MKTDAKEERPTGGLAAPGLLVFAGTFQERAEITLNKETTVTEAVALLRGPSLARE